MYIYLMVLIGMSIIGALAKTTGWRPSSDSNWWHALDVVALGIIFAWLVFNPF